LFTSEKDGPSAPGNATKSGPYLSHVFVHGGPDQQDGRAFVAAEPASLATALDSAKSMPNRQVTSARDLRPDLFNQFD